MSLINHYGRLIIHFGSDFDKNIIISRLREANRQTYRHGERETETEINTDRQRHRKTERELNTDEEPRKIGKIPSESAVSDTLKPDALTFGQRQNSMAGSHFQSRLLQVSESQTYPVVVHHKFHVGVIRGRAWFRGRYEEGWGTVSPFFILPCQGELGLLQHDPGSVISPCQPVISPFANAHVVVVVGTIYGR